MERSEVIELIESYDVWRAYRAEFIRNMTGVDWDTGVRPLSFSDWLAEQ